MFFLFFIIGIICASKSFDKSCKTVPIILFGWASESTNSPWIKFPNWNILATKMRDLVLLTVKCNVEMHQLDFTGSENVPHSLLQTIDFAVLCSSLPLFQRCWWSALMLVLSSEIQRHIDLNKIMTYLIFSAQVVVSKHTLFLENVFSRQIFRCE